MARIPWRGKTVNHFTVGQDKLFDYTTIQAALDAVETAGDNTKDNRYVITVAPGVYTLSEAIVHNRAFVDVAAEVPWTAVLVRDDTGSNGGTMRIGDAGEANYSELVEDVLIYGLRIVRDEVAGAKQAPESALFVGDEEQYPTTVPWDQITLQACCFEGGHDALQFFGVDDSATGYFSGRPPRAWFLQNVIRCQHDAVTVKGGMQMFSSANLVHVNPAVSSITPYLQQEEGDWKQTGFHFNANRPTAGSMSPRNPESLIVSAHDTYVLESEIQQVGTTVGQTVIAGMYFYDLANSIEQAIPRTRIIAPTIRVLVDDDGTGSTTPQIAGILLEGSNMPNVDASDFRVVGGSIDVIQRGDQATTPADVHGIYADGGTGALGLEVLNMAIEVETAKTAGNAYSLGTGAATTTIGKSNVISGQAADPANPGTITELTAVADN